LIRMPVPANSPASVRVKALKCRLAHLIGGWPGTHASELAGAARHHARTRSRAGVSGTPLRSLCGRLYYVRSDRAGLRVMESITRFITQKLKLKVNEPKSAVARPQERKFLGFSFTTGPDIKRTDPRRLAPAQPWLPATVATGLSRAPRRPCRQGRDSPRAPRRRSGSRQLGADMTKEVAPKGGALPNQERRAFWRQPIPPLSILLE
jgi:hypothetical protein